MTTPQRSLEAVAALSFLTCKQIERRSPNTSRPIAVALCPPEDSNSHWY